MSALAHYRKFCNALAESGIVIQLPRGAVNNNFAQSAKRFVDYPRVVHNSDGPVSKTERMYRIVAVVASLTLALIYSAAAKHIIPVHVPLPPSNPLKNSEEQKRQNSKPASILFSEKTLPTLGKAMAIGYYPSGCLQGGVELPTTGATWQVMRVSRNRNWGHPELVDFLERFA